MADDSTELAFSDQEPRCNPPLDLITRPPTLHVPAHGFDDGKRRLDHVGAAQRPGYVGTDNTTDNDAMKALAAVLRG